MAGKVRSKLNLRKLIND